MFLPLGIEYIPSANLHVPCGKLKVLMTPVLERIVRDIRGSSPSESAKLKGCLEVECCGVRFASGSMLLCPVGLCSMHDDGVTATGTRAWPFCNFRIFGAAMLGETDVFLRFRELGVIGASIVGPCGLIFAVSTGTEGCRRIEGGMAIVGVVVDCG